MTSIPHSRRALLAGWSAGVATSALSLSTGLAQDAAADKKRAKWQASIDKGLKWVAKTQSKRGHWTASNYPTAMTALAGIALTASGSTTTQGPYAKQIRNAVTYICDQSRKNGLIGDPASDNRYTYGHGFSMLFLSQVLGEEEDIERREKLTDVLVRAVDFCAKAQTSAGGWGYMSAKDGNDFDEGSTTITQVQGLRACRNAGIAVAKEIIERAKAYIIACKNADGGISYSSKNLGTSRPAITAAAIAALYDAGAFGDKHVPEMYEYAKKNLHGLTEGAGAFGHWHYTFLYYSQVVYRKGDEEWGPFRDRLYEKIIGEQSSDGSWSGNVGQIYITSMNLTMLQLDRSLLPIYQR
jgi:Prenyltransferase and squalene oxidase repeat